MTTSDYLTQLQNDKNNLVQNLETMGITGLTGDETFTALVPQVLNIPSGGGDLDWSAIGYSGTPQSVIEGYNYALNIKNNWDNPSSLLQKFVNDRKIIFMPSVDASNAYTTNTMFQGCSRLLTVSGLITSSSLRIAKNMFRNCAQLISVDSFITTNVTDMNSMFCGCAYLETVPQLDTSNATDMSYMFDGCTYIKNVPQYNTSNATTLQNMFRYSGAYMTDDSLENVLKMCININPNYNKTKTLLFMGFGSGNVPASKWQSLPSYQDFIDAGWTIGYS